MSAAARPAPAEAPVAPAPGGRKKLILIVGAALLLTMLLGGGATLFVLKQRQAAAELADADDEERPAHVGKAGKAGKAARSEKAQARTPPSFAPLDMFTVNLADREAERYAQIGITLELADGSVVDEIKAFMPAIRHHILMAIADKTAAQLMERDGKRQLAREVQRETSRVLGHAASEDADKLPVRAVHFSNFIIQ